MGNNGNEARMIHPSEFGMEFPINTPDELCAMARAINSGNRKRVGVIRNNEQGKPEYKKIEQK